MNPNQCSFCGRKKNEVEMLISGNEGFICENCIEQAHGIVVESSKKSKTTSSLYTFKQTNFELSIIL